MTATDLTASNKPPAKPPIGFFERYLTVWVALCIVAGVLAGQFFPAMFQTIGRMQYAQVNLPVGLLIWVMIIPMLVKGTSDRCTRYASTSRASASRWW